MATKATTAGQWEEAWAEYVEALEQADGTRPDRHRAGHVRAHNNSKTRLRRARARLVKLDPEFCERMAV